MLSRWVLNSLAVFATALLCGFATAVDGKREGLSISFIAGLVGDALIV